MINIDSDAPLNLTKICNLSIKVTPHRLRRSVSELELNYTLAKQKERKT